MVWSRKKEFGFAGIAWIHAGLRGHPRIIASLKMEPGFGPAAEALFFREKDPKPLTPRLASLNVTNANVRRADQLATLRQGPLGDKSVRPRGQPKAPIGQEWRIRDVGLSRFHSIM